MIESVLICMTHKYKTGQIDNWQWTLKVVVQSIPEEWKWYVVYNIIKCILLIFFFGCFQSELSESVGFVTVRGNKRLFIRPTKSQWNDIN